VKPFIRRILILSLFCLLAAPAWGYLGVPFEELKKAADAGDPESQNKMGVLFAQGIGLRHDKAAAFYWYKKAADAKYPPAMWNLAFMYVRGEGGVKEDMATAFSLFKEAAELGHADSQFDLSYMYLQGIGTRLDRAEGMKWLEKAAAQGQRDAVKLLKELQELEKSPEAAGHQKPAAR
jgi:TPR repeat protein